MDTPLRYFWGASYGSIYHALSDLVDRRLAGKRNGAEKKRNKIVYSITENGRNYLEKWLQIPVEKDELPYLIGAADTLRNHIDVDDTHKYYLITVQFGIKTYRTYLEWCKEAKAILSEESQ